MFLYEPAELYLITIGSLCEIIGSREREQSRGFAAIVNKSLSNVITGSDVGLTSQLKQNV